MKEVTIKIECGNAAFEPRAHDEVARILRDLADKFEQGGYITAPRDYNGNRVGTVDVVA